MRLVRALSRPQASAQFAQKWRESRRASTNTLEATPEKGTVRLAGRAEDLGILLCLILCLGGLEKKREREKARKERGEGKRGGGGGAKER